MSKFLICFALLVSLCRMTPLAAQSPNLYADANITMTSPGVYQTYNCSVVGTHLWTDSIYSHYAWSTGDTTPSILLPNPGQAYSVTLTVTNGLGNTFSSTASAAAVGQANLQVIYPFMGTETCAGDSLLIGTHFTAGFQTLIWSWGPVITNTTDCDMYLSGACYMYSHAASENRYTRILTTEGCEYPSFTQSLLFFAHPAQPSITQSNDTLYASVAAPRYVWYDGSMTVIPGITTRWYQPTVAGTYSVQADGSFSTPVCLSTVSNGYAFSPGGCGASYTWFPDTTGQYSITVVNHCTPTPANGGTYLWDFGDGNTSPQAYPQHQYAGAGTYHVCVTVSFSGCSQTYCDSITVTNKVSAPFTLNVVAPGAVAVDPPHGDFQVVAWPNPARDLLTFEVELQGSTDLSLTVMDLRGQVVEAQLMEGLVAGRHQFQWNSTGLPNGFYLAQVRAGNISRIHKLRIAH